MAFVIPSYSRQNVMGQAFRPPNIQAEPGPSTAGARALSQIGTAVASAGQDVSRGLNDLAAYRAKVEEDVRVAKFKKASSELFGVHSGAIGAYRTQMGQLAIDGRQGASDQYDKGYRKIQEKYHDDPVVLQRLEGLYNTDKQRFVEMVRKHVAEQSLVVEDESHQLVIGALSMQSQDAARAGDPFVAETYTDMAEAAIRDYGERKGWVETKVIEGEEVPGTADIEVLKYKTGVHARTIGGFLDEGRVMEAREHMERYNKRPDELDMGVMSDIVGRLGRIEDEQAAVQISGDIYRKARARADEPGPDGEKVSAATAVMEELAALEASGDVGGEQLEQIRKKTIQRFADDQRIRNLADNPTFSAWQVKYLEDGVDDKAMMNSASPENRARRALFLEARGASPSAILSRYAKIEKAKFRSIKPSVSAKMNNTDFYERYHHVLLKDELVYYEMLTIHHKQQADIEWFGSVKAAEVAREAKRIGVEAYPRDKVKQRETAAKFESDVLGYRNPNDPSGTKPAGVSAEVMERMAILARMDVKKKGGVVSQAASFLGVGNGEVVVRYLDVRDSGEHYEGDYITYINRKGEHVTERLNPDNDAYLREGDNLGTKLLGFDQSRGLPDQLQAPPPAVEPEPLPLEPLPPAPSDELVTIPAKDLKAIKKRLKALGEKATKANIQALYLLNLKKMSQAANALQDKAK